MILLNKNNAGKYAATPKKPLIVKTRRYGAK